MRTWEVIFRSVPSSYLSKHIKEVSVQATTISEAVKKGVLVVEAMEGIEYEVISVKLKGLL